MSSFFRGLGRGRTNSNESAPGTPPKEKAGAAQEAETSPQIAGAHNQDDAAPTRPPPDAPPPPPPTAGAAAAAAAAKDNIGVPVVENETEEDPVRAELETQVRQRDASISALEKARMEKQQELTAIDKELELERLTQMKEALTHKVESERIKRQTAHAEERLQTLEHDMQDKAAIHEYANLIKGVAPKGGVDSQYVVKLQAQLQKAVKKMESTTNNMKELEKNSTEVVDGLNEEISELVEERCRTELELRKQMEVLDEQKKDMQNEYENRILENLKTLQALRAKAASQVTIDELEEELEDTESKLEELHRVQKQQDKTIHELKKSLAAEAVI